MRETAAAIVLDLTAVGWLKSFHAVLMYRAGECENLYRSYAGANIMFAAGKGRCKTSPERA